MNHIEDLFAPDLTAVSREVCDDLLPDIAAALDRIMPRILGGADRSAVRRYCGFIDAAAESLAFLPALHPEALPPPSVAYALLRRDAAELPWVAPSADGLGIMVVLVDRLRGFAGGMAQECVHTSPDIDVHSFERFLKSVAEVEHEREHASPLRRAMATLDLSSGAVADLMGVKRQAVDKWLVAGPPSERSEKLGVVAEIADILRYRLKAGMPAVVARKNAEAYGGRSMLDVIASDEHEWLLTSVKESFDFRRVA